MEAASSRLVFSAWPRNPVDDEFLIWKGWCRCRVSPSCARRRLMVMAPVALKVAPEVAPNLHRMSSPRWILNWAGWGDGATKQIPCPQWILSPGYAWNKSSSHRLLAKCIDVRKEAACSRMHPLNSWNRFPGLKQIMHLFAAQKIAPTLDSLDRKLLLVIDWCGAAPDPLHLQDL